jgi:hypothetical protein
MAYTIADSLSQGNNTITSGSFSHAEGNNTTATGDFSHAEGSGTTAGGMCSKAGGIGSVADLDTEQAFAGGQDPGRGGQHRSFDLRGTAAAGAGAQVLFFGPSGSTTSGVPIVAGHSYFCRATVIMHGLTGSPNVGKTVVVSGLDFVIDTTGIMTPSPTAIVNYGTGPLLSWTPGAAIVASSFQISITNIELVGSIAARAKLEIVELI